MPKKQISNLHAICKENTVNLVFHIDNDVPVQIYRLETPDFKFNIHYTEFFDEISPSDATKIYEGKLPLENYFAHFHDNDIKTGSTYMYWVSDGSFFTGPDAVMARDPRVWWSYDKTYSEMEKLRCDYPSIAKMKTFGETTSHRTLRGLLIGNSNRRIACVGAIHAGESGAELMLPAVSRILEREPDLFSDIGIALLPTVNADEREKLSLGTPWYLRVNSNGVDLNRNFGACWDEIDYSYGLSSADPYSPTYRGLFPDSELETKAVEKFITEISPLVVLSCHALASVTEDGFLIAKNSKSNTAYVEKSSEISKLYSEAFRHTTERDGTCSELNFGCSPGSLPAWCYDRGIPCFDLEYAGSEYFRPCVTGETTAEMVEECSRRHERGLEAVMSALRSGQI